MRRRLTLTLAAALLLALPAAAQAPAEAPAAYVVSAGLVGDVAAYLSLRSRTVGDDVATALLARLQQSGNVQPLTAEQLTALQAPPQQPEEP